MEAKNPVGRPAMTEDQKRKPRSIKMSDQEWQRLQQRAADVGVSAAEYIRLKTLAGD
ncbi:MAG: hypothetical protein M0P69_15105 [Bacteroidales bacterium]|nr:hypothetical protein [Bacteroidales bacterium]